MCIDPGSGSSDLFAANFTVPHAADPAHAKSLAANLQSDAAANGGSLSSAALQQAMTYIETGDEGNGKSAAGTAAARAEALLHSLGADGAAQLMSALDRADGHLNDQTMSGMAAVKASMRAGAAQDAVGAALYDLAKKGSLQQGDFAHMTAAHRSPGSSSDGSFLSQTIAGLPHDQFGDRVRLDFAQQSISQAQSTKDSGSAGSLFSNAASVLNTLPPNDPKASSLIATLSNVVTQRNDPKLDNVVLGSLRGLDATGAHAPALQDALAKTLDNEVDLAGADGKKQDAILQDLSSQLQPAIHRELSGLTDAQRRKLVAGAYTSGDKHTLQQLLGTYDSKDPAQAAARQSLLSDFGAGSAWSKNANWDNYFSDLQNAIPGDKNFLRNQFEQLIQQQGPRYLAHQLQAVGEFNRTNDGGHLMIAQPFKDLLGTGQFAQNGRAQFSAAIQDLVDNNRFAASDMKTLLGSMRGLGSDTAWFTTSVISGLKNTPAAVQLKQATANDLLQSEGLSTPGSRNLDDGTHQRDAAQASALIASLMNDPATKGQATQLLQQAQSADPGFMHDFSYMATAGMAQLGNPRKVVSSGWSGVNIAGFQPTAQSATNKGLAFTGIDSVIKGLQDSGNPQAQGLALQGFHGATDWMFPASGATKNAARLQALVSAENAIQGPGMRVALQSVLNANAPQILGQWNANGSFSQGSVGTPNFDKRMYAFMEFQLSPNGKGAAFDTVFKGMNGSVVKEFEKAAFGAQPDPQMQQFLGTGDGTSQAKLAAAWTGKLLGIEQNTLTNIEHGIELHSSNDASQFRTRVSYDWINFGFDLLGAGVLTATGLGAVTPAALTVISNVTHGIKSGINIPRDLNFISSDNQLAQLVSQNISPKEASLLEPGQQIANVATGIQQLLGVYKMPDTDFAQGFDSYSDPTTAMTDQTQIGFTTQYYAPGVWTAGDFTTS